MEKIDAIKKSIKKVIGLKITNGSLNASFHGIDLTIISQLIKWAISENLFIEIRFNKTKESEYISVQIDTFNVISKRISIYSNDYLPNVSFLESLILNYQKEIDILTTQIDNLLNVSSLNKAALDEIKIIADTNSLTAK